MNADDELAQLQRDLSDLKVKKMNIIINNISFIK